MSTLRANTLKPITSGNSLVLQGDSGGSGVTGLEIDSTGKSDFNGKELILDVDGDTSITADTDDQIDFRAGGTDSVKIGNEHLTINDGNLVIGTAGHGIDFSINSEQSGMTSELFDFYETGTWSPIITNGTNNASSYTTQDGSYTRIGKVVMLWFDIRVSNFGSMTSGNVLIQGLPFNADGFSGTGFPQGVLDIFYTASNLASNPCIQISSASSIQLMDNIGNTSGHSDIIKSDIDTGTYMRGQIFYHAV